MTSVVDTTHGGAFWGHRILIPTQASPYDTSRCAWDACPATWLAPQHGRAGHLLYLLCTTHVGGVPIAGGLQSLHRGREGRRQGVRMLAHTLFQGVQRAPAVGD